MATKKPQLKLTEFAGVVAAAAGTPRPDAEIAIPLIDVERQVRTQLGDLTDLTHSIQAVGVLEPILVMAKDDGRYRLIAGERRLRAAVNAGLATIPAVIRRGLTEFEIRRLQVTENNERADLLPYDEAMGVAEDAETFGFKEATQIWNRSEAWVSKRVAVRKYAEPVRAVLQANLSGDLEVLHSLNQLFALDETEFQAMVQRLKGGSPISRDEARNRVAAVKNWKKQADAAAKERAAARPTQSELPLRPAARNKGKQARPRAASAEERAAAEHAMAEAQLDATREELLEGGRLTRQSFNDLQARLSATGYELTRQEWVLWSAFLDSVLPLLATLERKQAATYLRRLQAELKAKPAQELWEKLHPTLKGTRHANRPYETGDLAAMPRGWKF